MGQKNNFVYGIAYGKLYLAGEYAILEDGSSALLTSVDKTITAIIEPKDKTTIYDNLHNKEIALTDINKDFELIQRLIFFITEYIENFKEKKNFSLTIHNELHENNKKFGLGSSGAVLVAITKAMLYFYEIPFTNEMIFKLVTLFSVKNNISGSMGDVAASCNEGITFYKKFNHSSLMKLLETKSIEEIISSPWENLEIQTINTNINITAHAHWTGEVVDTKEHVALWRKNKCSVKNSYLTFVQRSNDFTLKLKHALEMGDSVLFLNTINNLRKNLLFLESFSGIPMETSLMKNYIYSYPAGKQSGSGSGDIVLAFEKNNEYKFQIDLILKKLV